MLMKRFLCVAGATIALSACGQSQPVAKSAVTQSSDAKSQVIEGQGVKSVSTASLDDILSAQSDEMKARYKHRNPKETIEFFGIKPGMTVVEVLPGGGWYSKILLPYLGDKGHLVGVDYALPMWSEFGGFADAEFIEAKKTWPSTWVAQAQEWRGGSQAEISAFAFENANLSLENSVDAVVFIRALHNLSRFEEKGGYMSAALSDIHILLKPGGIVGVVQHQAPEGNSDASTTGSNGYLKKSTFVAQMKEAGFELIKSSDINANPKDVPSDEKDNEDIVWRLPPALGTSRDNPDLKAKLEAIGESNRMTLLFKKI